MVHGHCFNAATDEHKYYRLTKTCLLHFKGDISPYRQISFKSLLSKILNTLSPDTDMQELNEIFLKLTILSYDELIKNIINMSLKHSILYADITLQWQSLEGDTWVDDPNGVAYHEDKLLNNDTFNTEWGYYDPINKNNITEFTDYIEIYDWFSIWIKCDGLKLLDYDYNTGLPDSSPVPTFRTIRDGYIVFNLTWQPQTSTGTDIKLIDVNDTNNYFSIFTNVESLNNCYATKDTSGFYNEWIYYRNYNTDITTRGNIFFQTNFTISINLINN